MKTGPTRQCVILATVLAAAIQCGCASMGANTDPRDPFESFNRNTYEFNKGMDEALFHPLTRVYRAVTPDFLDIFVSNFFSNLNEIVVIVNDFLQLKINQGMSDFVRFVVNSSLGIGGLMDVATDLDLPKHQEDFGQTLAVWGFGSGPYLVVPFLGPSTVRDAAGYGLESAFISPVSYVQEPAHQAGLLSLNYIDYKSDLEGTGNLVAEAALDEYEFMKSAYLSRRENMIRDRDAGEMDFEDFEDPAISPE